MFVVSFYDTIKLFYVGQSEAQAAYIRNTEAQKSQCRKSIS